MLTHTSEINHHHACLSCGKTDPVSKRRYCSVKCRQNLRQKLNLKNGLLQALNTKYATFCFSKTMIILDVVPYGSREIFRYAFRRRAGNTPAVDFSFMTNHLGKAWWAVSDTTHRNYLASQHVLKMAKRYTITDKSQRPKIVKIPAVKVSALNCLDIKKIDLASCDLDRVIKSAYRRQVKIHHPDLGGKAADFRKIHSAYKELLAWADHPVFIHRRGFPDKWFYSAETQKWVQPTPLSD